MEDLDRLIRLLDEAKDPGTPPSKKVLTRLMLRETTKYARELPLVNVDTGETKIVRSSLGKSARQKADRILVESRFQWDIDYDEFERWLRAEVQEERRQPAAPAWPRRLWWLHKIIKALTYFLRVL